MTSAWLLLLYIAGKISALGKDIAFAGSFGAGRPADAYFVANQLPGIIWLAVYGTILSVFAPLYVRRMDDLAAANRFVNEAIRYYIYAALLLAALCWAGADWLVTLAAPSADAGTHALAVQLTRIMVLGFALTGYVGVQSAIQQVHGHFLPPLAVPVINNLLAILAILLAWYWNNVAIAVAGAVGAYLVQSVIQRMQTRHLYPTHWGWGVSKDVWQRLSLLSGPVALSSILDQLNILIGNALASGFGTGAISQLNYASRLMLFLAGVFSWLVSYMFFPALASHAAREDDLANAALLTRALAIILITTAPAAAGALAMRGDVIALIYQRGAFSASDVTSTATLFGLLGIGIIFAAMRELLNRVFFSYQRTAAPLVIGVISTCVNIGASIALARVMGIAGIALGNALAAILFCAGQFVMLWCWKSQLFRARLLAYAASAAVAAITAYLITSATRDMLPAGLAVLLRLLAGGLVLMVSYVSLLLLGLRLTGITPHGALAELRGHTLA